MFFSYKIKSEQPKLISNDELISYSKKYQIFEDAFKALKNNTESTINLANKTNFFNPEQIKEWTNTTLESATILQSIHPLNIFYPKDLSRAKSAFTAIETALEVTSAEQKNIAQKIRDNNNAQHPPPELEELKKIKAIKFEKGPIQKGN